MTGKCPFGVTWEVESSLAWHRPFQGGGRGPGRHRAPPWAGSGGGSTPSHLVAVGAGAAVELHGVLAARPVVLAGAGEAGVALGHNADVHRPCVAKPRSVGGRSPKGLTVTPPQPAASPSPSPCAEGGWPSAASTQSPARVPCTLSLSSGGEGCTVGQHAEALPQSNQLPSLA